MSNVTYSGSIEHKSTEISDYFELLKPRVMSLAIFTAFSGLVLAPGKIHPLISFISILFTAIGAGAAGCLNMWYDQDIDALMERTKKRPIVRGVIPAQEALVFGVFLSLISTMGMIVFVNLASGIILLSSIAFYYFIYTVMLKRRTVQNIVIGGAAGAFPPMIGWAAKTGSITTDSIILFLIIFLWTPPHFWALALYKSDDYKKAAVPMMPVIYGNKYTKKQILIYTILMSAVVTLPYFVKLSGKLYLFLSSLLSLYFIYLTIRLIFDPSNKTAPKVFAYSILYLFSIFTLLIIDSFFI